MSIGCEVNPGAVSTASIQDGINSFSEALSVAPLDVRGAALFSYDKVKDSGINLEEWIDGLNKQALVTVEQATRINKQNKAKNQNYNEVAKDLGIKLDPNNSPSRNKAILKAANKKKHNSPERVENAKNTITKVLSQASEGRSDTTIEDFGRAKELSAAAKKRVILHSSADMSLLIDLLVATKINGKANKEGIKQVELLNQLINDSWFDAHNETIKQFTEIGISVDGATKARKIRLSSLKNTITDVPISGVEGRFYTKDQAIQIYMFSSGKISSDQRSSLPILEGKVDPINPADLKLIVDYVKNDADLMGLAEEIFEITDGWVPYKDNWRDFSIQGALDRHYRKDYMKELLDEYGWTSMKKAIFNDETYKQITVTYKNGNKVVESIKTVLDGMETGLSYEGIGGKRFAKILASITALPIGGNISIGVKQLSSWMNFIEVTGPNNPVNAMSALFSAEALEVMKKIWNSDYAKNRLGSQAYEVDFGLLTEQGNISSSGLKNFLLDLQRQAIDITYKPVSYGDLGAIVFGGAAYIINYQKKFMEEGLSEQEAFDKAFKKMTKNAETTQQSKLAPKLSAQQRRLEGKIILPFKSFQQQAIREVRRQERLWKRLGKGNTPQEQAEILQQKKKILGNVLYYRVVSPVVFMALSSAILSAMFDDDEEDKKEWAEKTLASVVEFNLVGYGIHGAILVVALKMLDEIYDQLEAENLNSGKLISQALNTIPAISIAERQFSRVAWTSKDKNASKLEIPILAFETATRIPVYNLYTYLSNMKYITQKQTNAVDAAHLVLGWKPQYLDIKEK